MPTSGNPRACRGRGGAGPRACRTQSAGSSRAPRARCDRRTGGGQPRPSGELTELNPEQPAYWYDLACCHALLGKSTDALDALERAVETGFVRADHAEQDPDLTSLRGEARFQELVARMRDGAKEGGGLGRVETLSRGFSHRVSWGDRRYRLAVMLGWTGSHGNSLDEVLACLRRGRQSDGTFPDGGFYLMANPNVRAKARMPFFSATVDALKRLGFDAEILTRGQDGQNGTLPVGRPRISGITAGTASFQWPKDLPDLLPGAIAEHLTSFGAHFGTSSQTKCTDFIRRGAAGTSGTVAEPFAIFMKFPLPFVHVHYARGCSLAEAFYQSVWGPYQLLILGDPLARPFARFREVTFLDPDPASVWSGRVAVRAATADEAQRAPAAYELFIDGRRVAEAGPGEPLAWDTTTVRDGVHDVRVVAIDSSPVATRSVGRASVTVKNHDARVTLKAKEAAVLGEALRVEGKASGLERVEILQGARVVAEVQPKGGRFHTEVPTNRLGPGRVVLTARGGPPVGGAVSAPVEIEISPSVLPTASTTLPGTGVLPGLRATIETEDGKTVEAVVTTLAARGARSLGKDLRAALEGDAKVSKVSIEGFVRLAEGMTEITLDASGVSSLALDDVRLLEASADARRAAQVLLVPGGWHALRLVAAGPALDGLGLRVGGSRAAGAPRGGDLTHIPSDARPATLPETVRGADSDAEVRLLHNGERGGKALYVSGDGIVFTWKKTERKVNAVVIYPARGKDAEPFPSAWIVETRSSRRGAWKPVKKPTAVVAPGPEAPRKDTVFPPTFLEIRFSKTSARQLRVRPADPKVRTRLTEIEVYRVR